MIRKRLLVKGQKVIERFFADNIFIEGKQAVYALIDSSEENAKAFIEIASSKFPENSDVEKVEAEDYTGNVMKTESYYRYLTAMQLSMGISVIFELHYMRQGQWRYHPLQ